MTKLTFISHEYAEAVFDGELQGYVRTFAENDDGERLVYITYCDEYIWKERDKTGIEQWIEGNVGYDLFGRMNREDYKPLDKPPKPMYHI